MTQLQRLTPAGIEAFLDELAAARERSYYDAAWLEQAGMIEPFIRTDYEQPDLSADDKLASTIALHSWLKDAGVLDRPDIWSDRAFWSWLAAANMKSLTDRSGPREIITEDASFVLVPGRERTSWRHKLASPIRLYDRHGVAARVALVGNLYSHGDAMEQMSSVHSILQSDAVMTAIDRLYWDPARNSRRRGMLGRGDRPGDVRRFKRFLTQIEATYDLAALTSPELVALMPKEFDRFLNAGAPA